MNFLAALSLLVAVIVTINAAPVTDDELKTAFTRMPSYSVDPKTGVESISSDDLELFLVAIGEEHTGDHVRIYKKLFDVYYGGRLPWDRVSAIYSSLNDMAAFAKELAVTVDRDHNGTIDKDELATCMDVLLIHNPELNLTYDQVLQEADIDKSGTIDVDEFRAWIQNKLFN